jgi:hypothetical protein
MVDTEHVVAFVVGLLGLAIGGYMLWTGRFTAGSKDRPLWNLLTLWRTKPVRFHSLTVRFIGCVVFGFGAILLVRVIA